MDNLLYTFILLLITIGILLYITYKIKQQNFRSDNNIKIISRYSLGTKEKLALLNVDDTRILIGITPTSICTLHVFKGDMKDKSLTQHADSQKEYMT